MLVLSRKATEEIVFPALGVSIRVIRIGGSTVKIGVDAPRSLKVVRGELLGYGDLIDTLKSIGQQVEHHDLRGKLNCAVLNLEMLTAAHAKGIAVDDQAIVGNVLAQLSDMEDRLGQQVKPFVAAEKPLTEKTRLLVVDDNQNERELLKSVLCIQGFDVDTAEDGDDAIRQLNCTDLPHAVLLDLHMPRLSGEKTLRCIRTDCRMSNLRVFGVSGKQPDPLGMPDGLRGFDAWFEKPLDLGRLVSLIQESSDNLCTVN